MPKGYWTASGHFLKGTEKSLGNGQIKQTPDGQMFLLAVYGEKSRKWDHQPTEDQAELPSGCQQKPSN
jgi:hypothetical protein